MRVTVHGSDHNTGRKEQRQKFEKKQNKDYSQATFEWQKMPLKHRCLFLRVGI